MSINKKLGLVLATFLILNLLLLGITLFSDQGNAGVQINLAGKQRMLSQKLTKAALSYANSGYSGLDQEEIKSAHDLFDKTLKGLHHGDRSLNLEGTLNESVIKQLEIVKGIWQPISENVNILLNSAKTSSQKDIALGVLKKDNLTLLAEMNIVVGLYEKAYSDSVALQNLATVIIVVITIVAVISAWIFVIIPLNKMLSSVVLSLSEVSRDVHSAASNMSSSAMEIADGASDQAASIEEISSSLEEVSAQTAENRDNTTRANSLATQAKDQSELGTSAILKLNEAINQIQTSSNETVKIIKTIDEIAFQTNLLALNAAVEAARAGEAGKGFAVVAEEVRNLAQRSAVAAKNTTELIEKSQNNAEQGVSVSREVGEILSSVNREVINVSEILSGVTNASVEQSQGISEINLAVAQMDVVTQTNAGNAENFSSTSEEMKSQAEEMMNNASEFHEYITGLNDDREQSLAVVVTD